MRIFEKLLGLLALGQIAGSYALAQDIAGSIRGTLTAGSGGRISNAGVTAIQSETGEFRANSSGPAGARSATGFEILLLTEGRTR